MSEDEKAVERFNENGNEKLQNEYIGPEMPEQGD